MIPVVTRSCDVAVVGGGLVGLSAAWHAARAGARVTVLERGRVVGLASRAAAAVIAPVGYVEAAGDPFLLARTASAAEWPAFADRLLAETGRDARYRVPGSLVAAFTRQELDRLAGVAALHERVGVKSRLVGPGNARDLEPGLADDVRGGLWVPGDGSADPEAAGRGLAAGVAALGGEVLEGTEVHAVRTERGRAAGVAAACGEVRARTVLLAAGAWCAGLEGVPEELRFPLRPVKGQSVLVRDTGVAPDTLGADGPAGSGGRRDGGGATVRTVLRAGVNLVPRGDGRLMLAGTVEDGAGFDLRPTAAGLTEVLGRAVRAVPAVAGLEFLGHAVGVRPVAADDAPVLGPSGFDGLWWATGHSYHGVLMAPLTGRLTAEALNGSASARAALAPFRAGRFTAGAPRYTALSDARHR